MKLRNKKTGKIGWLYEHSLTQDIIIVYDVKGIVGKYASLAELNEVWEDYEEPKDYYCIDWTEPSGIYQNKDEDIFDDFNKEIDNYFSSREEAEKAVEKLKAWKRLKDKGFKLDAVVDTFFCIDIFYGGKEYEALKDDLKIVFGGEE